MNTFDNNLNQTSYWPNSFCGHRLPCGYCDIMCRQCPNIGYDDVTYAIQTNKTTTATSTGLTISTDSTEGKD